MQALTSAEADARSVVPARRTQPEQSTLAMGTRHRDFVSRIGHMMGAQSLSCETAGAGVTTLAVQRP